MMTCLVVPFVLVGELCFFGYRSLLSTLAAIWHPREAIRYLYDCVYGGLPLALVLGVALGAVIWMQTRTILERTAGATELLPTVLAVAVLLELAPVGAGLIVASRTGANLGAELAAMRATEQTDALQALGISLWRCLVGPRILACTLTVPILHVLISASALSIGYVAETLVTGTTWLRYQSALFAELHLTEVMSATLKTFLFGWLVGVAGSRIGLATPSGSQGVGLAAKRSVVAAILLVLLADVVWVALARFF